MPAPVVTFDSQARRDERRRLWRAYVHTDAPQGSREGSAARVVRAPVRVRPPSPVVMRAATPQSGNPLPWLVVAMLALEVLGLLVLLT